MRQGDRTAAERLNTAWDSTLAGQSGFLRGLEPDVADRVHALHALAAPPPDPHFLAKLDASLRAREGETPWPMTGQLHPLTVNRTLPFPTPPVKRTVVAAVVLLTSLVGLVALVVEEHRKEPKPVQLAAVTEGTPTAIGFTVMTPSPGSGPENPVKFSECEMPPEEVAEADEATPPVFSLLKTTIVVNMDMAGNYQEPPMVMNLPDGPDASAEQLAGIEATIRQISVCRFYDSPGSEQDGRLFALLTESLRSTLMRSFGGYLALPWSANPLQPASVQLTRQLPDGRVLAVLVSEISYTPGNFEVFVAAFAMRGERWLIDELSEVAFWGPAGAQWEKESGIIELEFTDQEPGYETVSSSPVLVDGWSYTLVLYNPGAIERSFVSDGLGIDVIVPPYETRTVEFSPSTGEYSFETHSGNQVDEAAPPPCEGMPYPDNTMVIYPEPPIDDRWSCGEG